MTEAPVFSKLDLKWGYHQIELKPESRQITTYITHRSVCTIFNDIIVSGETTAQHDERLHQALQRIQEKQPLNGKKRQFRMTELGMHVLYKNTPSKIEAAENTCLPTNAAEVRSFIVADLFQI